MPGRLPPTSSWPKKAVEQGVIEAVRMVLSGVARSESRIACGKNLIAQMLCGSNSAKIKKLQLNQLSTFGLLWQLKQAEVATLIDLLIAIGCLEQEDIDRFRPVLKLTPLGGDVMRGKAELPAGLKLPSELWLKLRRPAAKDAARPKVASSTAGIEKVQKDAEPSPQPPHSRYSSPKPLQSLRQPPESVVDHGPPDDDSWIIGSIAEDAVEGGPGDSLRRPGGPPWKPPLPCPNRRRFAPGHPEQVPAAANRPPYYWTWRLLSHGFQAEECSEIRGITRETLLDHLLQAAENGLQIRTDWCLPVETIAALDNWLGTIRQNRYARSWPNFRLARAYQEVQIYLKCRSS